MRVLIDILHPAHVHFFKNFRHEMLERGHQVLVTARDKDVALSLLERLEIPHQVLSIQRSGAGLALEMALRTTKLISVAREASEEMGRKFEIDERLLHEAEEQDWG